MTVLRLTSSSRDQSLRDKTSRGQSSRDQVVGALCSATVPRPSGSSLMSLRRARHRPDLASTLVHSRTPSHSRPSRQSRPLRHSREGGNPVLSNTHLARCLGAWGEWRSVDLGFCQIKEEAEGRGTFAEPLTPSAEAYKHLESNRREYNHKGIKTPRCSELQTAQENER